MLVSTVVAHPPRDGPPHQARAAELRRSAVAAPERTVAGEARRIEATRILHPGHVLHAQVVGGTVRSPPGREAVAAPDHERAAERDAPAADGANRREPAILERQILDDDAVDAVEIEAGGIGEPPALPDGDREMRIDRARSPFRQRAGGGEKRREQVGFPRGGKDGVQVTARSLGAILRHRAIADLIDGPPHHPGPRAQPSNHDRRGGDAPFLRKDDALPVERHGVRIGIVREELDDIAGLDRAHRRRREGIRQLRGQAAVRGIAGSRAGRGHEDGFRGRALGSDESEREHERAPGPTEYPVGKPGRHR